MGYGKDIAKAGLDINAIKLSSGNPFTWASGFRMPIYNDNRMFLFFPEHRKLIASGFDSIIKSKNIGVDVIAGTSTSGIPPATTLADLLNKPLIYVRDRPKDHGLRNQIEGIDADSDLYGKRIILVEDLISTGGSSVKAVQAIRDAKGECNHCISIFNYGFDNANDLFKNLEPSCEVESLLRYDTLIEVAEQIGYIDEGDSQLLIEWRKDPFNWGEKHGFPRIVK